MEEKKTNYGKIVAITIAVISAASAIAYVVYRLCRNFFTFCDSYREDEIEDTDFDFDEIDEDEVDDLEAVDGAEAEDEATETVTEEAPAKEAAEEAPAQATEA
ncbi:MAG: hypothetical protein IJX39_05755 [Clostridia bacterium]|nr:hypothetical protein [Clostridia bacterium]